MSLTDTAGNINASNIASTAIKEIKEQKIYPNPVKDVLHIQTTGTATFLLTDQSGKILLTKTITNKGEMNVANLIAGLYYLKNNETGKVQKIIISR